MGDTIFWNNSIARWVIAAGVTLGLIVALRISVSAIAKRLKRAAARTETDIDDLIVELVDRTKLASIVVLAIWAGSYTLALSTRAAEGLRAVVVLGLFLQVGFWATAVVDYVVARYRKRIQEEDPGVATAMGIVAFVARVAVWSVFALIVLDTLGVDVTALIAGIGIGGIAIALAAQNVLGDLFASVSIIFDKPFVVGDFIVLDDYMGTVENVGLKTTRIRALSGEQLVVSNADLLSSRIRNFKRMQERRVVFEAGVVYGTPADSLRMIPQIIRETVESRENTRFDRSHFKTFGASALTYETVYYMKVPDYNTFMDTQEAINLELYERFETLGIEFAYPTQTLILHDERDDPPAGHPAFPSEEAAVRQGRRG
jgi:small-conductance mechanosensitive channel